MKYSQLCQAIKDGHTVYYKNSDYHLTLNKDMEILVWNKYYPMPKRYIESFFHENSNDFYIKGARREVNLFKALINPYKHMFPLYRVLDYNISKPTDSSLPKWYKSYKRKKWLANFAIVFHHLMLVGLIYLSYSLFADYIWLNL